jgi:hypothetical protein
VEPHPIRLVVEDDLQRSRLTVAPRLILALPHFFWLGIWSIGAFFAVIASWFMTLLRGESPRKLHDFLAGFVRYATHVYAYVFLAANPYPGFLGHAGSYPVDVEIDPPTRQSRWKAGFRLFLALPPLIVTTALIGLGGGGAQGGGEEPWVAVASGVGVAWTIAILSWFASLARGRTPEGFRNTVAYALRVAAQTYGYLLLLTDRYPQFDPAAGPAFAPRPHPVSLAVSDDLRRSRLTVFFRLLLTLPHFVWLVLWTVAAFLAVILNWLATLVRGRPPEALHRFLASYIRYTVHVVAFLTLVANPFPGFTGRAGSYPVDPQIAPPERQNRWVTGFRLVLGVPALLVSSALGTLVAIVAFFGWFAALATGRMPQGLRNLGAYALRYSSQWDAYIYVLTDRYPYSGPPA